MVDTLKSSIVDNDEQESSNSLSAPEQQIEQIATSVDDPSKTVINNEDNSTKMNPTSNNHNHQSKTKKRKKNRRRSEDEEREELLNIKKERYEKLLHQAKKHLLKHAKQCRTFVAQKQIRKLKQSSSTNKNDNHLKLIKEMPLENVVYQALRQLGLLHANPDPDADFNFPPQTCNSQESEKLGNIILTHKRFQQTLEEWHVKVTEYRRWTLHLDERQQQKERGGGGMTVVRKKGTNSKQQQQQQQPTSLFCSLNDDDNGETSGEISMSPYGPGAYMEDEVMVVKKNRKGQRARRAKAMAIQAKKEGKAYQSLNWRSNEEKTKKRKLEQEDRHQNQKSDEQSSENHPSWSAKREQPSGIVEFKGTKITFGEDNDTPAVQKEEQHPSWAAKQSQKTGIVAFKGTKITF